MPFPSVPDKYRFPSCYPPGVFLDALRAQGWQPGQVPESVVYTYARLELYLATRPDLYTVNDMLGTGPGRFFLVNDSGGRVGVNCLGIGAPAAVAQLELQAELGVRRCVSIGTAGGWQADASPGQVVLLDRAVRDEGTSYHYLAPDEEARPDPTLSSRYAQALRVAGISHVTGATVTTDAPSRITTEEVRVHRAAGVQAVEMEAAALFALGQARGLPVASAVVIDSVASSDGLAWRVDLTRAAAVLRGLFAATIEFLAAEPAPLTPPPG
jgi:uridine phosphorylase